MKRGAAAVVVVYCLYAAVGRADTPSQRFERLYGDRVKAALASRDKSEQVSLATQMLADAEQIAADRPLQAVLYCKAAELALADAKGDDAAAEAVGKFDQLAAAQAAGPRAQLLDALRQRYHSAPVARRAAIGRLLVRELDAAAAARMAAGDYDSPAALYREATTVADSSAPERSGEMKRKAKDLTARHVIAKKVETLKQKLTKTPNDRQSAAELVRLLVVGMQQPREAASFVDAAADPALSRIVPLAGRNPRDLNDDDALVLGDWFKAQSASVPDFAKVSALQSAIACYGRFLDAHAAEDGERLRVKLAHQQTEAAIAKIEGAKSGPVEEVRAILILAGDEFDRKYGSAFPLENNLSRGGVAKATSQFENATPSHLFEGTRTGGSWALGKDTGDLDARWPRPVTGRYILMFGRGTGTGDRWGHATIRINAGKPFPIDNVSSNADILIDLGSPTAIASIQISIHGIDHPGLSALEIHRAAAKPIR